jgi:sulfur-oxidizing protein SoxX
MIVSVGAAAMLLGGAAMSPQIASAAGDSKEMSMADKGYMIAQYRKGGNCFACHKYKGDTKVIKKFDKKTHKPKWAKGQAGDIGPPLVAMKARFPDKAKLRAQVYDATKNNPDTLMPPFGRNHMLNDKQIDEIVEWLYTL